MRLDNPENPVSEQNYSVGEPNWNDETVFCAQTKNGSFDILRAAIPIYKIIFDITIDITTRRWYDNYIVVVLIITTKKEEI